MKIIGIYILISFFWFFSTELMVTHFVQLSKNSVVYELIGDGFFVLITSLVIFFIGRQMRSAYHHKIQTLERYQQEYDLVIENSLDAIFFIENGKIIKCNPSTLRLFGCSMEEMIGQRPYHFSPVKQPGEDDSGEAAGKRIEAALNGNPQFL